MRMDEMNKYFESKGFEVEREYKTMGNRGYYEFTITKGENQQKGTYAWPEDQLIFMKNLIEKFEGVFDKAKSIKIKDVVSEDFLYHIKKLAERMGCKFVIDYTEDKYGLNLYFTISHDLPNRFFCNSIQIPSPSFLSIGSIRRSVKDTIYKLFDKMREELETVKYCKNDIKNTEEMYSMMWPKMNTWQFKGIDIINVIFNDPATIVFWSDGTKTVVKCQDDDIFDPEKGLAMAISKKALGNKGNYCNELKKWLPVEENKSDVAELEFTLECDGAEILKSIANNGITKTKSITFEIKDLI